MSLNHESYLSANETKANRLAEAIPIFAMYLGVSLGIFIAVFADSPFIKPWVSRYSILVFSSLLAAGSIIIIFITTRNKRRW